MRLTYIDANHRIIFKSGIYTPQYSPYICRLKFMRFLLGYCWSNWRVEELAYDSIGQSYVIDGIVTFYTKEEAEDWINNNKF
jgi:hypothetical protein